MFPNLLDDARLSMKAAFQEKSAGGYQRSSTAHNSFTLIPLKISSQDSVENCHTRPDAVRRLRIPSDALRYERR
jgi:hypothetical protein